MHCGKSWEKIEKRADNAKSRFAFKKKGLDMALFTIDRRQTGVETRASAPLAGSTSYRTGRDKATIAHLQPLAVQLKKGALFERGPLQ